MSALTLCHGLEQASPLVLLHLILRSAPRNTLKSGLRQSYGDHNRLLCHGLDKLSENDDDWFLRRRSSTSRPSGDRLIAVLDRLREPVANHWSSVVVAAALHDIGKLYGGRLGLDPEDALPLLGEEVLEALLPGIGTGLAAFVIRYHDAVERIPSGEVAAAEILTALEHVGGGIEPPAPALLATIQLVGAASLGDGRISVAKVQLCERMLDGKYLAEAQSRERLARLLSRNREDSADTELRDPPVSELANEASARLLDRLMSVRVVDWCRDSAFSPDSDPPSSALLDVLERAAEVDPAGRPSDFWVFDAFDLRRGATVTTYSTLASTRAMVLRSQENP